jgi:hypothetical protein
MGQMVVIDDDNFEQFIDPARVGRSMGCIPRNYATRPVGYFAAAPGFPLKVIPRDEWKSRIADQDPAGRLSAIRRRGMYGQQIPSRDQNGRGYCWAHSTCSSALIMRALMGLPYADLSAYMVACIIKNYRDQGGYGAESVKFIAENGIATSNTWPQQAVDRRLDTPAMRAEAKNNQIQRWIDFEPRNVDQFVTCLLLGIPVVSDFNWWSHSVCTLDLIDVDPADIRGSLRTRIWNSWGDQWSDDGEGEVKGRKALPDGMIAPLTFEASAI